MRYGSVRRANGTPVAGAIDRVEGFLLTAPFDPPSQRAFSAGTQDGFAHVVLRITDSDGASGTARRSPSPARWARLLRSHDS